jgi:hypothetical protein
MICDPDPVVRLQLAHPVLLTVDSKKSFRNGYVAFLCRHTLTCFYYCTKELVVFEKQSKLVGIQFQLDLQTENQLTCERSNSSVGKATYSTSQPAREEGLGRAHWHSEGSENEKD